MYLILDNYVILFINMIWVGLLGGVSYVNVMYLILENRGLEQYQKELALTITTAGNDIGILSASIISLILSNTTFKTV